MREQAPLPYPDHTYAEAFGPIRDALVLELRDDMRLRGYDPSHPIVLHDSKVLEGRHRLRAAVKAGVEPVYREFDGDDAAALAFVKAENMTRRHLGEADRKLIAANLARQPVGANQHRKEGPQDCGPSLTVAQAAKVMNVSKRGVEQAKTVLDNGSPELVADVKAGKVSMTAAVKRSTPAKPTPGVDRKAISKHLGNLIRAVDAAVKVNGDWGCLLPHLDRLASDLKRL
jgi:hypothetical protein